nr:hypothetical protein [Kofleriaceae bacterium]
MTRLGVISLVVASVLATACSHGPGPGSTLDKYGRALKNHDYGAAYDLMSASYRGKVSKDDYVRMMRDNPREADETADRLRGKHGSMEVSAELVYGLGDQMRLVQEDGSWRISTNPLDFYDQATPKAALRSFIRAYRLDRWDVMLRFVPNAYRDKMDVAKLKAQFTGPSHDKMETLMSTLEANVDQPITEKGNDARMAYGDSFEVKFVREDNVWKLKDLD